MRRKLSLGAMLVGALVLFACDRGAQPREEKPVAEAAATPNGSGSSATIDGSSATPAKRGVVDPAKREKILSQLAGFEHVPKPEALYAVEPDGDNLRAILLDIYNDKSERKGARQRALALIRHVPGDATLAAYEEILRSSSTPDADRRAATKAYGACAGEKGVATLTELLQHSDSHTRAAAAIELGEVGSADAKGALEARAKIETAPNVRVRIGQALGRDIGPAPTSAPTSPAEAP